MPLIVFGFQTLYESGAPAIRRANLLAKRIRDRKDWPSELATCRTMPEVKALRAALGIDASPALSLFSDPRAEVRVAALGALEFRKEWASSARPSSCCKSGSGPRTPPSAPPPSTPSANIDERSLVETLAQFLLDTSLEVRKAAVEAPL